MKKKLLSTTLMLCLLALGALAVVADLTGKWTGQVNYGGQPVELTYNFKVDGEKLGGTVESSYGPSDISNGKIQGTDFSFVTSVQGMEIPQSGKFYGDSVAIDIDVNGQKLHTTLTRAK
ncbi:hypothetical protein MUY27_06295 [Mucilaginibacter sp. RS28]|uniref:Glycoside hydrolase n=1 Tax=Mucilaginibacter straminoryzae TaxID=2932774 RepID=A0A9X2B8C0_9SPHI|nr:hypothetical protein [Mucilaginibacter straminoryzae]MCJ8209311.1 hypothetical protein [Mucilaginibacter straminoryzae]